jgi:hypothetical protein
LAFFLVFFLNSFSRCLFISSFVCLFSFLFMFWVLLLFLPSLSFFHSLLSSESLFSYHSFLKYLLQFLLFLPFPFSFLSSIHPLVLREFRPSGN